MKLGRLYSLLQKRPGKAKILTSVVTETRKGLKALQRLVDLAMENIRSAGIVAEDAARAQLWAQQLISLNSG